MDRIDPALRATFHHHLRRLAMPLGFHLRDLLQAVANHRGRPLTLVPTPATGGSATLLVTTGDRDIIHYPVGATVLHRNHLITRQVCHLVLSHQRTASHFTTGSFSPETARRHEREAEVLTTMLLMRSAPVIGSPFDEVRATIPRITPLWAFLERALGSAAKQLRFPELDHSHGAVAVYRRIMAIRDAQLLLLPYTERTARDLALAETRDRALPPDHRASIVEAAALASALIRFQQGTRVPAKERHPIPTAQHQTLHAEAKHLGLTNHALTSDQTVATVVKTCSTPLTRSRD